MVEAARILGKGRREHWGSCKGSSLVKGRL